MLTDDIGSKVVTAWGMLLIVWWFTPSAGFAVLTSAGSCRVFMWPSATVALGGFVVLTSAGSCKVFMWPSATVALGELLTQ